MKHITDATAADGYGCRFWSRTNVTVAQCLSCFALYISAFKVCIRAPPAFAQDWIFVFWT